MARKMRVEFEGAIYHVMCRGDRREAIFLEEKGGPTLLDNLIRVVGIPCPPVPQPSQPPTRSKCPDTGGVLGLRDRCILEVLYSCGLRRSEVTRLDLEDIDLARGVLTVRKGKGGRSRTVPLGEPAVHWLGRYLETARPRLEIEVAERALFISGYGTRLNPNYLGNWVKRTMKQAGIEKPGSCHLLRHTCATHMHDNGAGICRCAPPVLAPFGLPCGQAVSGRPPAALGCFIQQLLGHARLDTTQIYTEVSIVALQEIHARTHPHGKAKRRPTSAGTENSTEDGDRGNLPA